MQPLIPYWDIIAIPIGPVTVHGFGILVALGFVFGTRVACKKAARDGFDPEIVNSLVHWIVLGVFLGGHLGHLLFYFPEQMADDPEKFGMMLNAFSAGRLPTVDELPEILKVWQGLSSFGGFLATTLLLLWFFRKRGISFWDYGDTLAYGMMTGWMLGRFGCFAAHDHVGVTTEFWLGVQGICPVPGGMLPPDRHEWSLACHDLGLYEALWSGAMAIWFWTRDKVERHSGYFVGWMCLSYGPVRFVMDFYRHTGDGADTRYMGLTPAQYGSITVALLGAWLLYSRRNKPAPRGDWKPAQETA